MGWIRNAAGQCFLPALFAVCCFLWLPAILADNKLADYCITDAAVRESGLPALAWLRAMYGKNSPFVADWLVVLAMIGFFALPVVAAVRREFRLGTYLSILLAGAILGLYGNFVVYSQAEFMDKYSIQPVAVLVASASAFVPVAIYVVGAAVLRARRS
jgi:hypothetical protein